MVGGWRPFRVVLGRACRGLAGEFPLLRVFRCSYFCGSSCFFCLGFCFDFCVSGMLRLWAGDLPRGPGDWVSAGQVRSWGRGLVGLGLVGPPPPTVISLLAVCFVSSTMLFFVFPSSFNCCCVYCVYLSCM